ncbi:iron-sulfur cluster assembly protein, partial [Brevundimonas sp.]|uniref:iron-sulfur cluster assembly protein n=1 Tax=Brevundimonas sp. TaxID=1871086 RepID=UPI003A8E9FDE
MVDRTAVLAALEAVIDPKSGKPLFEAGLVQGLVVAGDRAGFVIEVPAGETGLYAPVRDAAEAGLAGITGMGRVPGVLAGGGGSGRPT